MELRQGDLANARVGAGIGPGPNPHWRRWRTRSVCHRTRRARHRWSECPRRCTATPCNGRPRSRQGSSPGCTAARAWTDAKLRAANTDAAPTARIETFSMTATALGRRTECTRSPNDTISKASGDGKAWLTPDGPARRLDPCPGWLESSQSRRTGSSLHIWSPSYPLTMIHREWEGLGNSITAAPTGVSDSKPSFTVLQQRTGCR